MEFGTFPGGFLFCSGYTYDEAMDMFKKRRYSPAWKNVLESTKENWCNKNWGFAARRVLEHKKTGDTKDYYLIVITRPFDFSDYAMTGLAHECLHLVSYYLRNILDIVKEDEALAYTHSFIMENILKELRNGKK
jgi:hypothetical protein